MTRSPQLDGLRGVAVSLVLLHHWTKLGQNIGVGLGNIGVQLFFVLSGFLITRILLSAKKKCLSGSLGYRSAVASFHLNRIARIWPVYYGTLIFVLLMGDHLEKRRDMLWHVFFASNLLTFERGVFGNAIPHFWTLAVEQQFYVLWPLLVLLVQLRHLETIIIVLITVAPITRMVLYHAGFTEFTQYNMLPFANFDSLGFGAIVALWSQSPAIVLSSRWKGLSVLSAISVVGFVGLGVFKPVNTNIEQTLYAIIFGWVVMKASIGFSGPMGWLLEIRPLVSLGIISYGVYVYHPLVTRIVAVVLTGIGVPIEMTSGPPLFYVLVACATLGLASVSWALIEKPVLAWRRGAQTRLLANTSQPANAL